MTDRRSFLQRLSSVPLLGPLAARTLAAKEPAEHDFLRELGVPPIINGAGAYTMMTGSLMRPEVVRAIESVSRHFVRLDELHDAVGKRIAALLGCEAAMVPSGAAAGLTLGTAACITGSNPDFIQRIPDTTGMKSEVLVQKTHRFPYDHMVRNCGIRLIEVETRQELESAINPRTALLLFLNKAEPLGRIKMEEFVQIGKQHGVPTFNDAAADVPPVENLMRPLRLGFDLIAVSGGKGIRGPQSAGLLLGRRDLIAAARGVRTERFVPPIANQVPHLRVEWDAARIPLTPAQLMQKLRAGTPSIELVPEPERGVEIASWMLQPGEAEIVAHRIRALLTA